MIPSAEEVRRHLAARLSFVHGDLAADRPLNELKLDSLDTLELLMVIDELYGVRLSTDDFRGASTIGDLAEQIAGRSTRART
jgi:acyl carrier protein